MNSKNFIELENGNIFYVESRNFDKYGDVFNIFEKHKIAFYGDGDLKKKINNNKVGSILFNKGNVFRCVGQNCKFYLTSYNHFRNNIEDMRSDKFDKKKFIENCCCEYDSNKIGKEENNIGKLQIVFITFDNLIDIESLNIRDTYRQTRACFVRKGEWISLINNFLKGSYNKNFIVEKIKNLLESNHNLILTGAPGTGKTYLAKEVAKEFIGEGSHEQISFVQFHPSYDYTDFVEGLRPICTENNNESVTNFKRIDGHFKDLCKKAINNHNNKFVFIIDEINRGDINRIFGELFFLIEKNYRTKINEVKIEHTVKTQYQNLITDNDDPFREGFYIPDNIYIIGTMNDIDRSIESLDFAIRRRFAWYKVEVEYTASIILHTLKNSEIIKEAEKRYNKLNQAILDIDFSNDYQIGASYFLKLDKYEDEPFEKLWNNHLSLILKEYLRGDAKFDEKFKLLEDAYFLRKENN